MPASAIAMAPLALMLLGLAAMSAPDRWLRTLLGGREPLDAAMLPMACGLVLLGAQLVFQHAGDGLRQRQLAHWKATPARVVSSDLREGLQPRSTNPSWRPSVVYSYQIGGRTYSGDRIAYRTLASSDLDGTAQWLAEHYPEGAQVTAWVDPANPERSVLDREGSPWTWLMAAIGAVLGGVGGLLLWQAWTGLRDTPRRGRPRKTARPRRASRTLRAP